MPLLHIVPETEEVLEVAHDGTEQVLPAATADRAFAACVQRMQLHRRTTLKQQQQQQQQRKRKREDDAGADGGATAATPGDAAAVRQELRNAAAAQRREAGAASAAAGPLRSPFEQVHQELGMACYELRQLNELTGLLCNNQLFRLENLQADERSKLAELEDMLMAFEMKKQALTDACAMLDTGLRQLTASRSVQRQYLELVQSLQRRWRMQALAHGSHSSNLRAQEPLAVDCGYYSAGSRGKATRLRQTRDAARLVVTHEDGGDEEAGAKARDEDRDGDATMGDATLEDATKQEATRDAEGGAAAGKQSVLRLDVDETAFRTVRFAVQDTRTGRSRARAFLRPTASASAVEGQLERLQSSEFCLELFQVLSVEAVRCGVLSSAEGVGDTSATNMAKAAGTAAAHAGGAGAAPAASAAVAAAAAAAAATAEGSASLVNFFSAKVVVTENFLDRVTVFLDTNVSLCISLVPVEEDAKAKAKAEERDGAPASNAAKGESTIQDDGDGEGPASGMDEDARLRGFCLVARCMAQEHLRRVHQRQAGSSASLLAALVDRYRQLSAVAKISAALDRLAIASSSSSSPSSPSSPSSSSASALVSLRHSWSRRGEEAHLQVRVGTRVLVRCVLRAGQLRLGSVAAAGRGQPAAPEWAAAEANAGHVFAQPGCIGKLLCFLARAMQHEVLVECRRALLPWARRAADGAKGSFGRADADVDVEIVTEHGDAGTGKSQAKAKGQADTKAAAKDREAGAWTRMAWTARATGRQHGLRVHVPRTGGGVVVLVTSGDEAPQRLASHTLGHLSSRLIALTLNS